MLGRVLIPEEVILKRVQELGQQISYDYRDKTPIIICVLEGATAFLDDLLKNLDMDKSLDFVQLSSYGNRTETSGEVRILKDVTANIEGRDVLIIDDIIDSGLTLYRLRENLLSKNPTSLKICVLLSKLGRRIKDIEVDYIGFEIPNEFVVGYGMDYDGQYRDLRYIATLEF